VGINTHVQTGVFNYR